MTQHPVRGFAAALAAVAALSVMDAVMKHLVLIIGVVAVSIWRSVVNLMISSVLYLPRRQRWPSARTLRIHVSRGVIVTVMAFLFFWGIGRIPLAQAIALTFIAPLIAMFLASWFLSERIDRRSIFGAVSAFGGVLIIVLGQAHSRPGPDILLGTIAILGSALTYAVNIVMMRQQALAAEPLEINFFGTLTVMALWIFALPIAGVPAWPGGQWLWICIAALLSTAGSLLFAWGYARGEASYLAVTEYSGFLWASALGWLVFSESLSIFTLGGAVLIVGGCLLAARGRRVEKPEIEATA